MAGPVSPERGREWEGKDGVDQEQRKQKYEDYVADVSPQAAAAGRREPYYLTYLKKYGAVPEGRGSRIWGQGCGFTTERHRVRAD